MDFIFILILISILHLTDYLKTRIGKSINNCEILLFRIMNRIGFYHLHYWQSVHLNLRFLDIQVLNFHMEKKIYFLQKLI